MELIMVSFLAVFLWFFGHLSLVITERLLHTGTAKQRFVDMPHSPSPPTPPARKLLPPGCTAPSRQPAVA